MGSRRASKFAVVPLGLELDSFLSLALEPVASCVRRSERIADDVLFTYTGRLVPIKRPDVMLRAVAIARGGAPRSRSAVVGDGASAAEPRRPRAGARLRRRRRFPRLPARPDEDRRRQRRRVADVRQRGDSGGPDRGGRRRPARGVDERGRRSRHRRSREPGCSHRRATRRRSPPRSPASAATLRSRRRMGACAREHVGRHFTKARLLRDIDALYSRLLSTAASGE